MIQPNELRIGNWVRDIKVGGNIQFKSFFGLCNPERWPEQYDPIPLTPEILEKAGFEYNHDQGSYDMQNPGSTWGLLSLEIDDGSFAIFADHKEKGLATGPGICKHLHQLQNLYFALTGEELQIEL